MVNKTSSAPAATTSTPFTPAPEDRLVYGGALIGWAFLVMTITGLVLFGFAFYQKKKQQRATRAAAHQQRLRAEQLQS
jgi:uncharacterized protein HemX